MKDGRDVYLFANSSDDPVDATVKLRGRMVPELWNPHTGSTVKAEYFYLKEHGVDVTRVKLKLDPVKSLFVVGAAASHGSERSEGIIKNP